MIERRGDQLGKVLVRETLVCIIKTATRTVLVFSREVRFLFLFLKELEGALRQRRRGELGQTRTGRSCRDRILSSGWIPFMPSGREGLCAGVDQRQFKSEAMFKNEPLFQANRSHKAERGPRPPASCMSAAASPAIRSATRIHLLDLGDNGLEVVLLSPELSFPSLARLASVCRGFRATLSETAFLRRLATAHGFSDARAPAPAPMPTQRHESPNDESSDDEHDTFPAEFHLLASSVDCLEALAVLSDIRERLQPRGNHIVFHLASLRMIKDSQELLDQYAALMVRYPRLVMRIDSHCGVGAPRQIAPQHSIQRACVVAQRVLSAGVKASNVTACAW